MQKLENARKSRKKTQDEIRVEREHAKKPPLSRILDLNDMEVRFIISSDFPDHMSRFCTGSRSQSSAIQDAGVLFVCKR